jgi:hypothetical protein
MESEYISTLHIKIPSHQSVCVSMRISPNILHKFYIKCIIFYLGNEKVNTFPRE